MAKKEETTSVAKQLADIRKMTGSELRQKYAEVFGEESRSGNVDWLVKRIAWRIQANLEGDLSERARARIAELANDADLRLKAPADFEVEPEPKPAAAPKRGTKPVAKSADKRLPPVGSVITRDYKKQKIKVKVRADGLEYEGELYPTLSAVAKAVTGSAWNGYLFFQLGQYSGGAK